MTDIKKRIDAIKERAEKALDRLEKAATPGRKRMPGDGDGDGIPYENRNRKKKGAAGGGKTYYDAATAAKMVGYTNPSKITDDKRLNDTLKLLDGKVDNYDPSVPLRYKVAVADLKTHIQNRITALSQKANDGPVMPNYKDGMKDVTYKGVDYYATGKTGTDMKSGKPSWEYRNVNHRVDERLWITQGGRVDED